MTHQESVLRSTETSMILSGAAFTVKGKSTSMFGGAKYMCSDIMQTMIPRKSCRNTKRQKYERSRTGYRHKKEEHDLLIEVHNMRILKLTSRILEH